LQATLMACNVEDPFVVLLLLALHKVSLLWYTRMVRGCKICPRPHSSWNIRLYQIVACLIHTSVLHTRFVCMYTHTCVFKLSHFTLGISVALNSAVLQPISRYVFLHPVNMSTQPLRLGWIGLGSMGLAMAINIQKHLAQNNLPPLKYWNRTLSRGDSLKDIGSTPCSGVKELVQNCDVIFISVSPYHTQHESIISRTTPR